MHSLIQHTVHKIFKLISAQFELICWITALVLLFFLSEDRSDISLCPISLLGWGKCPGCGIGHAMHDALRGHLTDSFRHHPLGIVAVIVLINRIKDLIIHQIKKP